MSESGDIISISIKHNIKLPSKFAFFLKNKIPWDTLTHQAFMDVGKKTYKRRRHLYLKFKLVARIKLCSIRVDFVFIQLFDRTLSIHNLIESICRSHIIFRRFLHSIKISSFPNGLSLFDLLFLSPKMGAVILKNTFFITEIRMTLEMTLDRCW